MTVANISFLSFMTSGGLSAILLLTGIYLWCHKSAHQSFIIAAFCSLIWSLLIAYNHPSPAGTEYKLGKNILISLETLRYGGWVMALLLFLKKNTRYKLPRHLIIFATSSLTAWLTAAIVLNLADHSLADNQNIIIWNNLILSLLAIIVAEQLFKNAKPSRQSKLLSICTTALFSYDIYLFTNALLTEQIDLILWQARGFINAFILLTIVIGSLTTKKRYQHSQLQPSRQLTFYSTSLVATCIFLIFVIIVGYYIENNAGSWGEIAQVTLLFIALCSAVAIFISKTIQSWISVWVNKHLFRHKYDYRSEWLALINALSRQRTEENFQQHALSVVANIFHCQKAALWLQKNDEYQPAASVGGMLECLKNTHLHISKDSSFCRTLKEHEWVFAPYASANIESSNKNEQLPKWIYEIPDAWFVIPLLTEKDLLGFIVLSQGQNDKSLSWEDLDLLKTVGRQIASYLDRHQAAEQLAESRQFEAFNKLSAFIMHDLKNLIAQQALVVKNAEKHKDNPAFVEDAIRTIDNSVKRMSNLLKKLQQDQSSPLRTLDLQQVLSEAVKRSQDVPPRPSLRLLASNLAVNADPERLVMCMAHLINNAQEATHASGFIDITLQQDGNLATILIEDNGEGMDAEFIKDKLFKPFSTTKTSKGMGIGAYQAKEYISSLGGSIDVDSCRHKGTTFTIKIPTIRR